MNKCELLEKISKKTGQPVFKIRKIFDIVLDMLCEGIKDDGVLQISRFGKFRLTVFPSRKGYNGVTMKTENYNPVNVIRFKSSKMLKEYVNS